MKRKPPSKGQIKQWLKQRGHDAAKVDGKKMDTPKEIEQALKDLHKRGAQ